jgi:hypothetical protein
MTTIIRSVFCPVTASEARKMVAEGRIKLISVADFPRGAPTYDANNRLAYFAIEGAAAAFEMLTGRVVDRVKLADGPKERSALLGAMQPA